MKGYRNKIWFIVIVSVFIFQLNIFAGVYKSPKVGLVLSGGGAKGFAHIGVLKVLEEHGIRPDYITGTSMGSIVGGLYALGYSATEIETLVLSTDWTTLLTDYLSMSEVRFTIKDDYASYPFKFVLDKNNKLTLPSGMIEGQNIEALFAKLTWKANQYKSFDDFPIPYRCVACDVLTGKPVIFEDGNLAEAMRSSMSIPTVFSAVETDSSLLVDGGMVINYPLEECKKLGADIIIGSYTGFDEKADKDDLSSMIKILARTSLFQGIANAKEDIPKTDIFILPELDKFGPESFAKPKQIIAAGELAARDKAIHLELLQLKLKLLDKKPFEEIKNDPIKVNQMELVGINQLTFNTVLEISEIDLIDSLDAEKIEEGISKLYATGIFDKVSYDIKRNNGTNSLIIKGKEKSPGILEAGVHYSNDFGPGVLTKFTFKRLLLHDSRLITKIDISESPKALLKYEIYFGEKKNLNWFISAFSMKSKMPNVFTINDSTYTMGHYFYRNNVFSTGLSAQILKNTQLDARIGLEDKALKLREGMEHIYGVNILKYTNYFSEIKFEINTLDDRYFPTVGAKFYSKYRVIFDSWMDKPQKAENFGGFSKHNQLLQIEYQHNIRFFNHFTISPEIGLGTQMENAFLTEKFFIGGVNYSLNPNSINMSGTKANSIISENYLKFGYGLQLKILDNLYLQHGVHNLYFLDNDELDNLTDEEIENTLFSAWYVGVGTKSILGPIRLQASMNSKSKVVFWSLNIGMFF